jgi:hypothetical protein
MRSSLATHSDIKINDGTAMLIHSFIPSRLKARSTLHPGQHASRAAAKIESLSLNRPFSMRLKWKMYVRLTTSTINVLTPVAKAAPFAPYARVKT